MIFKILSLILALNAEVVLADRILHADQVVNDTNSSKINNQTSILYDDSALESLDWKNRRCKDPSNKFSLDWNNRITWDAAEITSIDWGARQLQDSSGNTRVHWENGTINNQDSQQIFSFATQANFGRVYDLAPDIVCCDGTTNVNLNSNIQNSADVINRGLTNLDVSLNFDPSNNGFKIGDATSGNFYLINAQSSHTSAGEMGTLTGMNLNLQLGDPANVITGGKANSVTGIWNGGSLYDGHEINGWTVFQSGGQINGQFKTGSGFNLFNAGFTFGSTVGDFLYYNGFNHNPQFANIVGSSHNLNGFSNSWQFQNGFDGGGAATAFSDFAIMQNGSTLDSYSSMALGPQFVTGSDVTTDLSILKITPNGGAVITSPNVYGLNVDMSQMTGRSSFSKTALNIQEGKINANMGFNMPDATQAFAPYNFNAQASVQSGSPISGSFGFINNFSTLLDIQDDMGDDGLGGLKLGLSGVGSTGIATIASGKTLDAYNGYMQGSAVLTGSGGTINKWRSYRAAGLLPSGGSVTINDMVAFYVDPIFCSFATDCWSFYDSSGAENFMSKLAIGTSSKKVSTNVKLEVHDGHIRSNQTTAPVATADANAGTGATCSVSNATDTAGNITLVSGSTAFAAGAQCAITFDETYNTAPVCVVSPRNAESSNGIVQHQIYFTTTTTTLVINYGVQENTSSLTREWSYHCTETN